MKRTSLLTFLLFFSFILGACRSSSTPTQTIQTFTLEEKEFLHTLFQTEYYWYDQTASTVDYSLYTTPQEMINALTVNPPDKWSFTMTQQEYEDYANQVTQGFGFSRTSDFLIYSVRINAPAYQKLFRGDRIILIDGENVNASLLSQVGDNLNVPTTFTVLRQSALVEVSLTPRPYSFNVSLGKILTQGEKKIGYLRYDSFTQSSVSEFEAIFTTFHDANIDELIIDMRYNGGGSVAVASALLDNITNAYPSQRQLYLDWNANYQSLNDTYHFEDASIQDGNELSMKRVVFLTTQGSASASEAVISALIPYLGRENVILIGDATHGKPVGMSGRIYGINYYFLINFQVKNNLAESSSFDGITPTCIAKDDVTHLMGDTNETMLKTALYYLQTSLCL